MLCLFSFRLFPPGNGSLIRLAGLAALELATSASSNIWLGHPPKRLALCARPGFPGMGWAQAEAAVHAGG